MTRQTWTALISGAIFVILAAVIALTPVPFVAWSPGSTYDVLSKQGNTPVIEIIGEKTYPSTGSLHMTTVSVTRVDSKLTLPEAIFAFLRPHRDVLPREAIYPVGKSNEKVREEEKERMNNSQRAAIVAGLRAAGKPVMQIPQITNVIISGPSHLRLRAGDYIEAVDGQSVTSRAEVEEAIRKHAIGDRVQLDIERDGAKLKVSVNTVASNDNAQTPRIGIELENGYRYAPKISFRVDGNIAGSSAGLTFALGVYDLLTEGDLIAGRTIAATGEITADGTVNAIGGVQEKLKGAKDAGATIFLVPSGNCSDLRSEEPGVRVVKVSNLTDAINSLNLLAANPGSHEVPRC